MKISELILKLQAIQSEHGDLECRKYYGELDSLEGYVNKRDDYAFVKGMLDCRNKILGMYKGEKV